MTEPAPILYPPTTPLPRSRLWGDLAAFLPGLLIAVAATWVCYRVLGGSLGLFFSGILLCAIAVPPLVLAEEGLARPLMAAGAMAAGVAGVWFWVTAYPLGSTAGGPPRPWPTLGNWAGCTAVLLGFVLALAGVSLLLRQMRISRPMVGFLVVLIALAWLAWPVWLSPWLGGRGRAVGWLVPPHPLLTVNSVIRQFGLWDEQPLAYNLTVLNRDVTYTLPAGIASSVLVHGFIGVVAAAVSYSGAAKLA